MKAWVLLGSMIFGFVQSAYCWGFFAHKEIHRYAIYLLPPDMGIFFKAHRAFLIEHAVDPDKRRYVHPGEAPRHFIDMDRYGAWPYSELPRDWKQALARYGEDTLTQHGILPWWIGRVHQQLTDAFYQRNGPAILKLAADLGHYIADGHVPLHTSSNHNGQLTHQHGIHGFWESRLPETFATGTYDFLIGRAQYLPDPSAFIWDRILESAAAVDSVLSVEKTLSEDQRPDQKYAFEIRNGVLTRQYAHAYTTRYHLRLNGMVERRMRAAIFAVASFWYTAWVNAGQPDLYPLVNLAFSEEDQLEWDSLNREWLRGKLPQRSCSN